MVDPFNIRGKGLPHHFAVKGRHRRYLGSRYILSPPPIKPPNLPNSPVMAFVWEGSLGQIDTQHILS